MRPRRVHGRDRPPCPSRDRPQRYESVFFGFWLTHVPPGAFDRFWGLVRRCLRPEGRVGFVDEDARAAFMEDPETGDRSSGSARRTLCDGRRFEIVKVFWDPTDLGERLRQPHFDVDVTAVGDTLLYGCGRCDTESSAAGHSECAVPYFSW